MPDKTNAPVGAYEVKAAVEDLGQAFEEYKATHDVAEMEKKTLGKVDALVEEKLSRLNDDLTRLQRNVDSLQLKKARPGLAGEDTPEASEYKSAFLRDYVRKGREGSLAALEQKALNITTDADGGFAVPEEIDHSIDKLLRNLSPIRRVANVIRIGSGNFRKLVNTSGAASGWVGEQDARTETDAPQFSEVVPPLGEIYANPAATQSMLDDSFFNVEDWLAEELAAEFAQKEGAAFVAGDGTNKPRGFLAEATSADADDTRAFGTLQHVATGVDGDWPASDPSDILVDLVHALKPAYRAGAHFVMSTGLLAEIRKFKDADGNYLWRPGLAEGVPATLMGYPVIEAEDMPAKASDSLSLAFGNFARGYTVTDRMGTRVLRDPFSNKPFVHFYTTKRVGGAVTNSEAIKLLKFSLS